MCGRVCAASEACTNGVCQCPTGTQRCNGVIGNPATFFMFRHVGTSTHPGLAPTIPLVIFAMAAEISPVKLLIAGVIPALASLIVGAYHTAGQFGSMSEQPFPYAEHLDGLEASVGIVTLGDLDVEAIGDKVAAAAARVARALP